MKIRTDIERIVYQYIDENIGIENSQRENFLRFHRNIEYILGLKVGMNDYNNLRGVLALNHLCEQKDLFNNTYSISEYIHSISPRIYVTLHIGCYEEIVCYLIKKEGKVCIPVTERVYNHEIKHYVRNLENKRIKPSQLVFVNIESSMGLRQIIRYAQNGYSLLCYIDGNSGVGGMSRNDSKLERIPFFNTIIHVRKGVEYLSKILNAEVVPIYSYIEDVSYNLQVVVMPPVVVNSNSSITKEIWYIFSRIIWKYFLQWEAWLYVDEFIDQDSDDTIIQLRGYMLNENRYNPLVKLGVYYYYDRYTNSLVKVSRKLFELLTNMKHVSINTYAELKEYIPKETLLNDLLNKKIIIKK